MSISLKIEKKFTKLGTDFIEQSKKKFYAEAAKQLPYVIASTIQKGISPVEGIGRFKQYSPSYVDQIEGRVKFFRKGSKTIAIRPDIETKQGKSIAEHSKITYKNGAIAPGKLIGAHSKLSFKGSLFAKGLGHGKLKSPVNMTVTGVMVGSIQGDVVSNGALISFNSPIAKYHNGQGRVDRHILPKGSETFSSLIMKKLRDLLREAFNN